jgi:hypothetical protein
MPIDFESTTLTYPWAGFGSATFGAIPVSVVVNPDKTGNNLSNKVLKIEKPSGAIDSKVDFTKGTKVK